MEDISSWKADDAVAKEFFASIMTENEMLAVQKCSGCSVASQMNTDVSYPGIETGTDFLIHK